MRAWMIKGANALEVDAASPKPARTRRDA
jgi:hypothetical protein